MGKISFIDLAGSESAKKSGVEGEGFEEMRAINKSLTLLGDVICDLSKGLKTGRYRENKLTQLMHDSLGGNAKTLMFVNCSPSMFNYYENKNTLDYAKRVK